MRFQRLVKVKERWEKRKSRWFHKQRFQEKIKLSRRSKERDLVKRRTTWSRNKSSECRRWSKDHPFCYWSIRSCSKPRNRIGLLRLRMQGMFWVKPTLSVLTRIKTLRCSTPSRIKISSSSGGYLFEKPILIKCVQVAIHPCIRRLKLTMKMYNYCF